MMAADGKGAVPAGTYSPTASIGWLMRSQRTPGIVSTEIGAGRCASWKPRTLRIARSIAASCAGVRLASATAMSSGVTRNTRCRRHRSGASTRAAQRRHLAYGLDDGRCAARDSLVIASAGRRSRASRSATVQRRPCMYRDTHQASIFSTGRTRSELAPAAFRFSSVSQNTFSRQTAWTATLSSLPSSGITVGASDARQAGHGSRRAPTRGACSMMYLLSRTCRTPSSRCRILSHEGLLFVAKRLAGLDDDGLAFEQDFTSPPGRWL